MKNNPTNNRKPSDNMTHTMARPRAGRAVSQGTDVESMASSGMAGAGYSRAGRQNVCDNMYSIGDGALSQNYGRGPTRGNESSSFRMGGPNPERTIARASGGVNNPGGIAMCAAHYPDPDRINVGSGPRKGNK
jgi:hypothetical protein